MDIEAAQRVSRGCQGRERVPAELGSLRVGIEHVEGDLPVLECNGVRLAQHDEGVQAIYGRAATDTDEMQRHRATSSQFRAQPSGEQLRQLLQPDPDRNGAGRGCQAFVELGVDRRHEISRPDLHHVRGQPAEDRHVAPKLATQKLARHERATRQRAHQPSQHEAGQSFATPLRFNQFRAERPERGGVVRNEKGRVGNVDHRQVEALARRGADDVIHQFLVQSAWRVSISVV